MSFQRSKPFLKSKPPTVCNLIGSALEEQMSNPKQNEEFLYRVTQSREILNIWREEGEEIKMLPTQAKYYLS